MIEIWGVPITDWVITLAAILGWLIAILQKFAPGLPRPIRRIIRRIGERQVVSFVAWAEDHIQTPEARREAAVEFVKKITRRTLGVSLPTSIASLIVEWALQRYKMARRRR